MTNEEAIKRIHRFVETYKICGKDNYNPATNITKLDYEAFKTAIESLKQMESISNKSEILTGWIPVSERLPEEETDVLICNANGDRAISRGSYSTEVKDDFIWYTSGWRFGKVIAWMPLPEPYKAESEDEE